MTEYIDFKNKWALLIGINKYNDQTIRKLEYSVKDVSGFYNILTDPEKGNFCKDHVKFLTDEKKDDLEKATRSNVLSELQSLNQVASREDLILFYFSGHGFRESEINYLVPLDARVGVLNETAIELEKIKNFILKSTAKAKIMIFDSCHSEARLDKTGFGPMPKEFFDAFIVDSEGTAILSSCKSNEVSYEWPEKGHSVFTYYLMEGLNGAADTSKNMFITISDINKYVFEKVRQWAFTQNKQQTPHLSYTVFGDIILVQLKEKQQKEKPQKFDTSIYDNLFSIKLISEPYYQNLHNKIGEITAKILLPRFEIEKITKGNYRDVVFPIGNIDTERNISGGSNIIIELEYSKERHTFFIDLLNETSNYTTWDQIKYVFNKSINLSQINDFITRNKMTISTFIPKEKIEILAKGWGRDGEPGRATFFIDEKKPTMVIQQHSRLFSDNHLEEGFIGKLHPDLLLPIINCLFKKE